MSQQIDWSVGSPVGVRTRICFASPDGKHPLTPEVVREKYASEIRNSAFVVWRLPESHLSGVRAGIDEVTWRDEDVAYLETSFCRPGKGPGYIVLAGPKTDGKILALISSDQYDAVIYEWHLKAAAMGESICLVNIRTRDEGYDT